MSHARQSFALHVLLTIFLRLVNKHEYPDVREILEVKAHLHDMHACPLDREGVRTELVSAEELDAMPKRSRS